MPDFLKYSNILSKGISVKRFTRVLNNGERRAWDPGESLSLQRWVVWPYEGLIPGLGRSPGGGHGNPLYYSCLENSMDRGASWATLHGVTESQTANAHTNTLWCSGWIGLQLAYSTASLDLRFNLTLNRSHFILFLVPLRVLSCSWD